MPLCFESLTPLKTTGLPSIWMSPSSGAYTPPRIFISVLLPAPFSPIRASTSPALSESETPCSATTPGKRLVMPCIFNRSGVSLGEASLMAGGTCFLARFRSLNRLLHLGELGLERVHVGLVDHGHAGV